MMRLGVLPVALLAAVTLTSSSTASAPTLHTAILDTAPAYYYPLATDAADASGNGGPTLAVTDANAEGVTGTGLTFTGTAASFGGTQYLDGGPAPAADDFTVGTWFSGADPGSKVTILLRAQGWKLVLNGDASGKAGVVGWVDRSGNGGQVARDVSTGEHQLIAVDQGGTLSLYLDGAVVRTFSGVLDVQPGALSVGSFAGEAGFNTYHGLEHDVAGWTRALTSAEVAAMWTAGGGDAPALRSPRHRIHLHRHMGHWLDR